MLRITKDFNRKDYDGLKLIGSGTFGKTYSANDKKNNITIVIKQISKKNVNKPTILAEVGILSQLKNKCKDYVLCFIDFREDDKYYFIITEFLDNYITLNEFINYHLDNINYKKLIRLVNNLLKGLKHIHQAGIAHRDIKPENIMVNPIDAKIKFIDFGLSCRMESCHQPFTGGTLPYMAPEIIFIHDNNTTSLNIWFKADYWSMGMTILEFFVPETFIEFYSTLENILIKNNNDIINAIQKFWKINDLNIFFEKFTNLYDNDPIVANIVKTFVIPLLKNNPNDRHLKIITEKSGKKDIKTYNDLLKL